MSGITPLAPFTTDSVYGGNYYRNIQMKHQPMVTVSGNQNQGYDALMNSISKMGLAGAGISAANNLIGGLLSFGQAKQANKLNKDFADYQFNKNLEMWNLQNAYNSPKAQMERFKEAGLNPNLIYGKGTPGNAQQLPKYSQIQASVPDWKPNLEPVQTYMHIKNQENQNYLLDKQIQLKGLDVLGKNLDNTIKKYLANIHKNKAIMSEYDMLKHWDLVDYSVEMKKYQLEQLRKTLEGMDIQSEGRKLDNALKEWKLELSKNGISESSPDSYKQLYRILKEKGQEQLYPYLIISLEAMNKGIELYGKSFKHIKGALKNAGYEAKKAPVKKNHKPYIKVDPNTGEILSF